MTTTMTKDSETQSIFTELLNKDVAETIMNHHYKNKYGDVKSQLKMDRYNICSNCELKFALLNPDSNHEIYALNAWSHLDYCIKKRYHIDSTTKNHLCTCQNYRCDGCLYEDIISNDGYCGECNKTLKHYKYNLHRQFEYPFSDIESDNDSDEDSIWTIDYDDDNEVTMDINLEPERDLYDYKLYKSKAIYDE